MASVTKELSIDVAKLNTFEAIVTKQYDNASRFLKVTLTNEGEAITVPSGCVVTINARREDEAMNIFEGSVNDDGTVTVPITHWMLELDGTVKCDIAIYDGDEELLKTTLFELQVEQSAVDEDTVTEDDENYGLLVTLLSTVSDALTSTSEATTAANEAAEAANTAAENIETAIANAESATEAAKTATDEANTAAEEAKTATENANTATANANTATANANTATSEAKTATENANTATANAETATENANTATANANEATANAEEATEKANTATANAEEATEKANTAAENANTAADNANASAEKCDAVTAENLEYALASLINSLDGTFSTYKEVMRKCYLLGSWDSVTAFCDWWYGITRDSWTGGVEFYQPDVSAVSTGTKVLDNAELTCTPSTDTVAGQDDYAGLPLFAPIDVNWEVDADTLQPVITAIDGITDNFKRSDPEKFVGVMQMSGYFCEIEGTDTYTLIYSANRNVPYPVEPVPNAVNADGSFRQWVLSAKYMSHTTNSKMTSCSGLIPTAFTSHNTLHTLSKATGTQYSGTSVVDDTWLYIMARIKYASLTMDGIMQGCVSNNYQYVAQVSETGVKRILISSSNNLEVGMSVLVGDYAGSVDRGTAGMYSISGNGGCVITKIETVTIDEVEYSAVYVDLDDTFDTTANGSATEGTTYVSTWHWRTGTTDCVLGNDGSPVSNTSGKYPYKLQGIEIMNGAYEVFADVILSLYQDSEDESVYYYEPYVVTASANQSTTITSNYVATGLTCEEPSSDNWRYIIRREYAHGVYFATLVGGTSSTYTRDGFYQNANATGTREWLARGSLSNGSGNGGLSCLHGNTALSSGHWHCAARLSACGNRGEWVA